MNLQSQMLLQLMIATVITAIIGLLLSQPWKIVKRKQLIQATEKEAKRDGRFAIGTLANSQIMPGKRERWFARYAFEFDGQQYFQRMTLDGEPPQTKELYFADREKPSIPICDDERPRIAKASRFVVLAFVFFAAYFFVAPAILR